MHEPALALAGVTRLALNGPRAPKDAFVFDPHRQALPSWWLAVGDGPPAHLLTLDRHFDLVPPADPAAVPDRAAGLRAVDEHARWSLAVRNTDHVIAAMEAGIVADCFAVARASPSGALTTSEWRDRRGGVHRIERARTPEALALTFGERLPEGPWLLDVDLDCFTTPSDADPRQLLPWPKERIREFLLAPEAAPIWDHVLPRCLALTLAREPYHCGGLVAGAKLFADVAEVLFVELLGVDLP